MNVYRTILLTMIALGAASLSLALDNAGLIKLVEAGFDEDTIILKMESEPAEYDLSLDGLIALKEAGIPETVIKKAIQLDAGIDSAPASNGTASAASTPQGNEFAGMTFPSVMADEASPVLGQTYYTRINFWHEGNEHVSTNYSRGLLVPLNTQVELIGFKSKYFELRIVDTGETIKMVNVPKYTGESVESLPSRYLSAEPTVLDELPERMVDAVMTGDLRLGMTKELALMTRGFPPVHETPSTRSDRWVYWSSRFVTLTVLFREDRLIEGRGIY